MQISLAAEPLFYVGTFPITNTLIVAGSISALLMSGAVLVGSKLKLIPGKVQNVAEYILEAILGLVDSVTHDREQSEKFFPLIATIFIFVICSNWIEILPGLGTIGIFEEHHGELILIPFLRSSSADLNVTIALALISVFGTQLMGITMIGLFKHAGKYLVSPIKKPYIVGTFVGLLEIISEISRIISFSFRLFGNIFAGEVLLLVMLMMAPYIIPLPFLFLELFVGFVQALVFSMLTLVFLKIAVSESEH